MALLEVRKLTKNFGGLCAIQDLDIDVLNSEILGLIGPNGAGKTTLFNIISGFFKPSSGTITFNGQDITGLKAYEVAKLGIARSFQACALFTKLTVLDNVFTGFHMHYKRSVWKELLRTGSAREEEKIMRQKAMELLDFTGLTSYQDKPADELSSGYRKLLAISIALATNPKLLLLDEPVTTLSPDKVEMIMELVRRVRDAGTTVVVIEHNMKVIMDYCDRIMVLGYGEKLAEGSPQEIRESTGVAEAYLGVMD